MTSERHEIATLGGGCFWCLEAAYEQIGGVRSVVSGYAGGAIPDPTYAQVCSGKTGHAEVVQITFDPAIVSFPDLLDIFFTIHDPTTLNRQGADSGTQYRSVIFYHDETQRNDALAAIQQLEEQGIWRDRIVTEVAPAPTFYAAEAYHQHYYARNPSQGYCMAVIAPKLAKLRKHHFERLAVNRSESGADREHPTRGGSGASDRANEGARDGGSASSPSLAANAARSTERPNERAGQVRPFQGDSGNPMDQGGIAD